MSTIKATTLSNLAGDKTIGTDRVAQGTAAAWVNFNGTGTVAIRASYNVSSITDVAAGDYQVNFTTPMADTSFAWAGSARIDNTATDANFPLVGEARQTRAAGNIRIYTCFRSGATTASTLQDCDVVSVAVFR